MNYSAAIFLIIGFALGYNTSGQTDSFLELKGEHRIHVQYQFVDNDKPLVVLQSGARSTVGTWSEFIPILKEHGFSYLAYDRPGLGQSDAIEGNRSAKTISNELNEILNILDCKKEIILVGHSMGGMYSAIFNANYPELVKGLVMVDTPNGNWENRIRSCLTDEQNIERNESLEIMRNNMSRTIQSEFKEATTSFKQLDQLSISNKVLVVTGSQQSWPQEYKEECLNNNWNQGQKELLDLFVNSTQLISNIAGHNIPQADPTIILKALNQFN